LSVVVSFEEEDKKVSDAPTRQAAGEHHFLNDDLIRFLDNNRIHYMILMFLNEGNKCQSIENQFWLAMLFL
jgi:hypothetical protein